ncbi:MAG: hypothetical protein J6C79_00290 [Clostridia bacterium]|nr:hypothetical protein [Clostridia bacterium]
MENKEKKLLANYEGVRIDVISVQTEDVVTTSPPNGFEGAGEHNPDWN